MKIFHRKHEEIIRMFCENLKKSQILNLLMLLTPVIPESEASATETYADDLAADLVRSLTSYAANLLTNFRTPY